MRKLLVILAALAPAACGDGGAARRAYLASLVGQPEQELLRQLGVPTRTYEAGGHKFLAYDDRRVDILPGSFFGGYGYGGPNLGYYTAFPPTVVERGCETTFEVAGGRVQAWRLRGPSCV